MILRHLSKGAQRTAASKVPQREFWNSYDRWPLASDANWPEMCLDSGFPLYKPVLMDKVALISHMKIRQYLTI